VKHVTDRRPPAPYREVAGWRQRLRHGAWRRDAVIILVDTIKMRRPIFADTGEGLSTGVTGRVDHDERGNAVWEWAKNIPGAAIENTGLAIVDDDRPLALATVRLNKVAAKTGYNPYESGLIEKKKAAPKKRDLRELSRWIEQRKQRGEDTGT